MGYHDQYRFIKSIDSFDLHKSRDRLLAFTNQNPGLGYAKQLICRISWIFAWFHSLLCWQRCQQTGRIFLRSIWWHLSYISSDLSRLPI